MAADVGWAIQLIQHSLKGINYKKFQRFPKSFAKKFVNAKFQGITLSEDFCKTKI